MGSGVVEIMVLDITRDRQVHIVSSGSGYEVLEARAVVLAMCHSHSLCTRTV